MNKQIFKATGTTENDFIQWCEQNHKPKYKDSSKQEFFARIIDGRLVKKDGKIVKQNKRQISKRLDEIRREQLRKDYYEKENQLAEARKQKLQDIQGGNNNV